MRAVLAEVAAEAVDAEVAFVAEFDSEAGERVDRVTGFQREVAVMHVFAVDERTRHIAISVSRAMDGIVAIFALRMVNREARKLLAEDSELFEEWLLEVILFAVLEWIPLVAPEARVAEYAERFFLGVTADQMFLADHADIRIVVAIVSACVAALLAALGAMRRRRNRKGLSSDHRREFFDL